MRLLLLLAFPISIFSMGSNDYDLAFHFIKEQNLKMLKKHFVSRPVSGVSYERKALDPDQFIQDKGTPLGYAAFIGNMKIFKFLFKHSECPNNPGFVTQKNETFTPFQVAVACERFKIAQYLIKKGVVKRSLLQRTNSKESLLIAQVGNPKFTKKLLKVK